MSIHPIFLNYRRVESLKDARHLYRELLRRFPEQVFMDAPGTTGGQHFPDLLRRKAQECRVMVAVIGPDWHRLTDEQGRVRLQREDDWVRLEIATALQHGMAVIPALIDGARMPLAAQIPPHLHGLLSWPALRLDLDDFFDASIDRLCNIIQLVLDQSQAVGVSKPSPPIESAVRSLPPDPVPKKVVSAVSRLPMTQRQGDSDAFETPWVDIDIKGVIQRMRWIKPGTFLMGCDPDDPNGQDHEQPQHRVTLTRGFWLADTACTQGLWQAVMGENPSGFKGSADLPVEQVSWDDVTERFLPELTRLLGVRAELPTEAEWEYACRAGTQTPYWFGKTISPQKVNFDDSAHGKTVKVKSMLANNWGLYQMHGNVWEWCSGGRRQYGAQAVMDPPDNQKSSMRIVRGGSWISYRDNVRSAYRFWWERLHQHLYLGFRFALRSPGP